MTQSVDDGLTRYLAQGDAMDVPDGTCLFRPGDESSAFLIVTLDLSASSKPIKPVARWFCTAWNRATAVF